jgi:hypothetical protein
VPTHTGSILIAIVGATGDVIGMTALKHWVEPWERSAPSVLRGSRRCLIAAEGGSGIDTWSLGASSFSITPGSDGGGILCCWLSQPFSGPLENPRRQQDDHPAWRVADVLVSVQGPLGNVRERPQASLQRPLADRFRGSDDVANEI